MRNFKLMTLGIFVIMASGCGSTVLEHQLSSPDPVKSGYFETREAKFNINFNKGQMESRYSITLKVRRPLIAGGYVEVEFENPQDKSNPVRVARPIGPQETVFTVESPVIYGRSQDTDYEVTAYLYKDASKIILLSTHRQMIRSLLQDASQNFR